MATRKENTDMVDIHVLKRGAISATGFTEDGYLRQTNVRGSYPENEVTSRHIARTDRIINGMLVYRVPDSHILGSNSLRTAVHVPPAIPAVT